MRVAASILGVALLLVPARQASARDAPAHNADAQQQRQIAAAIEQTYSPETRAAGIAVLEQHWTEANDSPGARRALARALSWDGRLEDALAHYEALIDELDDAEVVLEQLQVLLWMGRTEQAGRGYLRFVRSHPDNAAAHVGLARVRRWGGRPLAALAAARRATLLASDNAEARDELASVYLDFGLPYAGSEAAPDASPEVRARLTQAKRPRVAVSGAASSDSFGIERVSPRAKVGLVLPGDFRLEVGGGSSHLRQSQTELSYGVAAGALSFQSARVEVGVGGAFYGNEFIRLGEGHGWLSLRASDEVGFTLGVRRRPLLEAAYPLAMDDAAFFAAGSGGATDISTVARRGVDELNFKVNAAPISSAYVYADVRAMLLSDDNRGYSSALGLGIDLFAALGLQLPVGLIARADSYIVGFRDQRAEYFSPGRFDGHVIGGQLVWRIGPAALSGNGGRTFSVGEQAAPGWSAGGGLDLSLGSLTLSAKAERRDDLAFASRRAWLSITTPL